MGSSSDLCTNGEDLAIDLNVQNVVMNDWSPYA